jgi:hypothetical protein
MKLCLISVFIFISSGTFAKRFSNQYLEFDLPNSWECLLEGAEWICQSTNEERKKEAMIIFAAKNRGPKDSIEEYQAYLKKPKNFLLPGGQTLVSEPKYATPMDVNGHRWIDSLHLASEIPGFYTRYMATVKEDLGVVVTFSVARDSYSRYKSAFDKIIASIRIFRQSGKNIKTNVGQGMGQGDGSDSIFVPEDATDLLPGAAKRERKSRNQSPQPFDMDLILIIAVVAAALFFILKKKKNDED